MFAQGEANIGVTKVNGVQSLKMTLLSPIATLDNVQKLLAQVHAQANQIGDAVKNGTYQPVID